MRYKRIAAILLVSLACDRPQEATKGSGKPGDSPNPIASPTTNSDNAHPGSVAAEVSESTKARTIRRPLFTIGELDGNDNQIFGQIRSIQVDSSGNIYVLDDQSLNVRWFDREGKHRGTAGRSGGGPGEFKEPIALGLDEAGRVQVLDVALRRISTFAATDSGLVLAKERTIPLHAFDFCRMGNRYFFLASKPNGLIHELGPADTVIASFGEHVARIPKEQERHTSVLRQVHARGRLHCFEDLPLIVFFPPSTPLLQAFTPAGQLRWSTVLPDYHEVRHELIRNGRGLRVAPDPASGTAHYGHYLVRLAPDTIAITLRESGLANPEGQLEVRLFSLTDGRQISTSNASAVLAFRQRGREYSYVNHPYPQILVTEVANER